MRDLERPYIVNHDVYAQIEPDGRVYVCPYKLQAVAHFLPAQPAGYPLTPEP